MADSDEKERGRDQSNRDRDRSRRDRPRRLSGSRDRSGDRGNERGNRKHSNNRVYVSNICYEYRWQDLKDLFRTQVGDVSFVELFVDENDKPRGCGIVEFSDAASVKKCMEVMHRFEVKGRKLVIKEDFGNDRDKYGRVVNSRGSHRERDSRDDRDDRRGNNMGPPSLLNREMNRPAGEKTNNEWGNTYGLSPQFLEALWINGPLLNRVFVANLDYKVDKKKLKEVFRLAGRVCKVDLSVDKDGNSRGFAVVEYEHPVEAVQAISMLHNQQLFDRVMTVRMDRVSDRPEGPKLPEGLKGVGMGLGSNGEPLKDVSRNLPSNSAPPQSNAGAGILGAVPNPGLQSLGLGNAALNNVVNTPSLAGLSTSAAALQASLAGISGLPSSLLSGSLGQVGQDLGLANLNNSLVNNSLVQNQSLAALANSGNLAGAANSLASALNRGSGDAASMFLTNNAQNSFNASMGQQQQQNRTADFSQARNEYSSGANRDFQNTGGSSNREYETGKRNAFDFDNREREIRQNAPIYSTVSNGAQQRTPIKTENFGVQQNTTKYSDKVLITNLPPSASYKMVKDKFSEFGQVIEVEDKGAGCALVYFSNNWDAARSIEKMDRARIDGRTIDVRFFY